MGIPFLGGGQSGRRAFEGGRWQGHPRGCGLGAFCSPRLAPHSCCASAVASSASSGGRGHRFDF